MTRRIKKGGNSEDYQFMFLGDVDTNGGEDLVDGTVLAWDESAEKFKIDHNALATAHGLTANISAALTAASGPSAANEYLTRQALTNGVTLSKKFVSDAATDAVLTVTDTTDSSIGQLANYLFVVKNQKTGWGADNRTFSIRREGGVFAKDYFILGVEADVNLFGSMLNIASDLDVNGYSLAAKNNSNHGPLFTFRDHAGAGTMAASTIRLGLSAAGLLAFGGFVNTAPALLPRTTTLDVKLGDNSAYASLMAKGLDLFDDSGSIITNIRIRRPSDGFHLATYEVDWDGNNGGKMYFKISSTNNPVGSVPNLTPLAMMASPTDQGAMIGFFGATPVLKPTGVAVTAVGIHAALVSLGLIAA